MKRLPAMQGVGELYQQDDPNSQTTTIYLKPRLLIQKEAMAKHRRQHHWYNPLVYLIPVSTIWLWLLGISLLLYPLAATVLAKVRSDHPPQFLLLDLLAVAVLDMAPRVISAILMLYFGACLTYAAIALWKYSAVQEEEAE